MAWKKGQSGNPGGRPKISQEVSDLAKRESPAAFRRIVRIAKGKSLDKGGDKPSMAEVHKANQYILDRAYGKPETAGNNASGLFAGATIMVDTGIRRELEPPTVDVTPSGSMNGHDKGQD